MRFPYGKSKVSPATLADKAGAAESFPRSPEVTTLPQQPACQAALATPLEPARSGRRFL